MSDPVNIFWFRRDLRLNDNHGLFKALNSDCKVLPIFIFDTNILDQLPRDDSRVAFIYRRIEALNQLLVKYKSGISVFYGTPEDAFRLLSQHFSIKTVFANHDYEPYARERDTSVGRFLKRSGIDFLTFKDQVLFEAGEILKSDGNPYVVFTPYSKIWLQKMSAEGVVNFSSEALLYKLVSETPFPLPVPERMGFNFTLAKYSGSEMELDRKRISSYGETRNFPGLDSTTRIGVHLRFGTISPRDCIRTGKEVNFSWLSELIWREFFMQVLAHFPHVVKNSFRKEYDRIHWLNDEHLFKRWCDGTTGYPMVDAGMRELSQTGFMHNRVRMVVASFLTKHLLIDWRWGEAWFAEKLMDFELSSNNGNWQWAAGTGCDAAPYFRIFNPSEQAKKFDPDAVYIRKWVPEYGTSVYPDPIVEHTFARQRCLAVYQSALKS